MSALAPIAPKLGRLVRMLGSPVAGEVVAAATAIGRTLKSASLDWHDLADRIEHEPDPVIIYKSNRASRPKRRATASQGWNPSRANAVRLTLQRALAADILNEFETEFAESILASIRSSAGWRPSPKQAPIVDRIVEKAQRGGVAR